MTRLDSRSSAPVGVRRRTQTARTVAVMVAVGMSLLLAGSPHAEAGIVPPVTMGTADQYSVLGATTVTNTNPSVLGQSVGLSPGSSIVGFPPGVVLAPGTIEAANATTLQAQSDLTTAYVDAASRPVEFTQTNPDLVAQTLIPGVYSATAKAPLGLSGQLVLDGQGNADAVFIFQTDSTLITSSGSSIALINGASECNVFWQVGSSATLGSGSTFVGNILALTSITVESNVVVHGRALARNGAVTLDNDVVTAPSCVPSTDTTPPTTATTAPPATDGTTSTPGNTGVGPTVSGPGGTPTGVLPETGRAQNVTIAVATLALLLGTASVLAARRRTI